MSCSFIIALFHNMYLYLRIVLDRIPHTKREASTASRLFNKSCMAQTKCRNKLSPQIVQTIRELGLDFVITGQASSIRQRRQDKQTKGNNLMQVTQRTVNITLCSFRTFRSKLMTCLRPCVWIVFGVWYQTKCRNKFSPQIAAAIRELGLGFVIICKARSIQTLYRHKANFFYQQGKCSNAQTTTLHKSVPHV